MESAPFYKGLYSSHVVYLMLVVCILTKHTVLTTYKVTGICYIFTLCQRLS